MLEWCPVQGDIVVLTDEYIAKLDNITYEDLLAEILEGCPQ